MMDARDRNYVARTEPLSPRSELFGSVSEPLWERLMPLCPYHIRSKA